MSGAINLSGDKYGRLTVISKAPHRLVSGVKRTVWNCVCECGGHIAVTTNSLRRGNTKSCGCQKRDATVARNTTHGNSKHPLYQRWAGMVQRCNNPNHIGYKNYGAKGVKVCESWLKFENFLADMGEPKPGESLDRYPNAGGNYEPGNCRWATAAEQSRNTNRNVIVTVDGKSMTVRDWEIEKGVNRGAFQRRVDLGWPLERVVTEPIQPGKALEDRSAA